MRHIKNKANAQLKNHRILSYRYKSHDKLLFVWEMLVLKSSDETFKIRWVENFDQTLDDRINSLIKVIENENN